MKSSVHRIQFVWLEGGARGHQYEGVSVIPEISPPPPREGGLGWGPDPARSAQGGARAHLMAFVPGREANPGSFSSVVFIVWLFQWIKGRNLKISMF